jgi:hypothetical protein
LAEIVAVFPDVPIDVEDTGRLHLDQARMPAGCGVGWSTSAKGALKSVTWKLFIAALPFLALGRTLRGIPVQLLDV